LLNIAKEVDLAHIENNKRPVLGKVSKVFYSRRTFMFPEEQPWPHHTWEDEVGYLNQFFTGGKGYDVGKTGQDHWNVYFAGPQESLFREGDMLSTEGLHQEVSYFANSSVDQTLEILMTELDMNRMHLFDNKPGSLDLIKVFIDSSMRKVRF
jgi:S-adenosylmethionine decarboxylase